MRTPRCTVGEVIFMMLLVYVYRLLSYIYIYIYICMHVLLLYVFRVRVCVCVCVRPSSCVYVCCYNYCDMQLIILLFCF